MLTHVKILFDSVGQLYNQFSGQGILVWSMKGDFAYQWRKRIPRKECDHKTEPGKEENSAILIEWVEDRNRHGFPVGRVDLWRGVEDPEGTESHVG